MPPSTAPAASATAESLGSATSAALPLRSLAAAALLREGRPVVLPATGSSMRPLFAPGDRLRVRPARAADARPGDIVVIATADRLVAHRLVYATPTALITRGDDAATNDVPAPPSALVGIIDVPPSPHSLYSALRALLR
jgi:hypothetical protein